MSHTIFGLPLAIFLLHNFMKEIPASLVEAARVDGAGHVKIFLQVLMPLLVPAIAAFAIFQFLWVWNDLLVALTFSGDNTAPITKGIQGLTTAFASSADVLPAAAIIAMIVPLGVFLSLQRFFVRGLPGVSAPTRQNVEQAAAALGYVASRSAAALTTGRTGAIGVMAPWISRWFFSAVIEGAQDLVAEQGYDTLLYPLGANAGPDAHVVDTRALHKRVDGILGLNVPLGLQPSSLRDLRIPLVTVGSSIPGISGVLVDDVEVGYLATCHLIGLGHRRIAFLGNDPDHNYGFTVAADRECGYEKALHESRIEVDPALIGNTGFPIEAGVEALDRLWLAAGGNLDRMPTAVFAVSDEVAMGVLFAARRHGIRVPEDLSVIGVDNHDMSYLFDLTTIGQPVREQGRIAAGILLDHMRVAEPPVPQVVRLDPKLMVRNTTALPRADR